MFFQLVSSPPSIDEVVIDLVRGNLAEKELMLRKFSSRGVENAFLYDIRTRSFLDRFGRREEGDNTK